MEKVKIKQITHKKDVIIIFEFKNDPELIELFSSSIPNFCWNNYFHRWVAPYYVSIRKDLFQLLRGKYWLDYSNMFEEHNHSYNFKPESTTILEPLKVEHTVHLEKFKNYLLSKRYSHSTIKTYTETLITFLRYFPNKTVSEFDHGDIVIFNNEYIHVKKLSASYQNQVVNGVKLFFRVVENKKMIVELIHRPRREKKLPNILSKEEVKSLLEAPKNIKHKAMLSLIYACGLRRSELLHLTLKDIQSDRNILVIKQSKGKKDRIVPLSNKVIELLRAYYKEYKPKNWLFEGQFAYTQYSAKSLESVLKQSLTKANIGKPVSLHWLRHSYATHLLESGTDLRYIQELLGHKNSKTTEIYTHVSTSAIKMIKSPFDDL